MKSDPSTAGVPVIFLTSRTEAEPRARALGAAAFLAKPLHVENLLATIARHVKR
jgi:DNA-binding response OmpR family regulator